MSNYLKKPTPEKKQEELPEQQNTQRKEENTQAAHTPPTHAINETEIA